MCLSNVHDAVPFGPSGETRLHLNRKAQIEVRRHRAVAGGARLRAFDFSNLVYRKFQEMATTRASFSQIPKVVTRCQYSCAIHSSKISVDNKNTEKYNEEYQYI